MCDLGFHRLRMFIHLIKLEPFKHSNQVRTNREMHFVPQSYPTRSSTYQKSAHIARRATISVMGLALGRSPLTTLKVKQGSRFQMHRQTQMWQPCLVMTWFRKKFHALRCAIKKMLVSVPPAKLGNVVDRERFRTRSTGQRAIWCQCSELTSIMICS